MLAPSFKHLIYLIIPAFLGGLCTTGAFAANTDIPALEDIPQCMVIPGDINGGVGDGSVDIIDVVFMVGVVTETGTASENPCMLCFDTITAASIVTLQMPETCSASTTDVSEDGDTNVVDVVSMVSFITGSSVSNYFGRISACKLCYYDVSYVMETQNCEPSDMDCAGICNGSALMDACGVCEGDGPDSNGCCAGLVPDCAGVCGGELLVDECGVCGGIGVPEGDCDCHGHSLDCEGVCGGEATPDCEGVCGGAAMVDTCGVCGGEGPPEDACDCEGNVLDACDVCGGDAQPDLLSYCIAETSIGGQGWTDGCAAFVDFYCIQEMHKNDAKQACKDLADSIFAASDSYWTTYHADMTNACGKAWANLTFDSANHSGCEDACAQ